MQPWTLIDRAEVPATPGRSGQGTEISPGSSFVLYQRGDEFSIRVDNWELMNSRATTSEEEIASLACDRLLARRSVQDKPLRVLVGGLGLGYTLRAALDRVPSDSQVVVSELVPAVVDWNRQHFGHLAGNPLDDPRVEVAVTDAAEHLRQHADTYDAIILDVDNGPHTQPSRSEGWLYSPEGLQTIHRALHPGGIVSIWSAGPCPGFTQRMKRQRFQAEEVPCRGRAGRGNRYVIWMGEKPDR